MKIYGQFCPLAQAAQILCERWTLIIVRELVAGSTRFGELQKGVPRMSPTLLSTRLKQMLAAGIISKKDDQNASIYELTKAGRELRPIIELMGAWGHRWARSSLDKEDLDAGLLMWDMRRSINTVAFPKRRTVVEFQYHDAPKGSRNWWIIAEGDEVDLCLQDPGYEVDLVVQCSLRTMTEIWICDRRLNSAMKAGDVKILGDSKLAANLQQWLSTSALSRLGSSRELPELNW